MNKIIIPVLASILILGTLGISYDAFAADGNNGNKGCEKSHPKSKVCEKNPHTEVSIDPRVGDGATFFTITDPEGRIQAGDKAFFYLEGTDPAIADDLAFLVSISSDGTTLTGFVPQSILSVDRDNQFFVHVAPTSADEGRFPDLAFFVTSGGPTCPPNCGR